MKLPWRKAESLACLLLVLTSVFVAISFLPQAEGSTAVISMIPTNGNVGQVVQFVANISTANGTYQILWDNYALTANASATGNSVNASFAVPFTTSGDHNVTIVDWTKGENATTIFTVYTAYSIQALQPPIPPTLKQEGDSFQIFLNMTGGEQGKTNAANVTVVAPNNAFYTSLENITTGNDGNGNLTVNYPEDFSTGANTAFVGVYKFLFNGTFASGTFYAGLTNSSQYHRNQAVDVKAVYAPGENVNLTISGGVMNFSETLTADTAGIIYYVNPTVLSNASIGVYVVNLTSVSGPTKKSPPDVQSFTVPGFNASVITKNLAGEVAQNVPVTVYENSNLLYNVTSDVNGSIILNLEIGNYVVNATYRNSELGRILIFVNEANTSFVLPCNLTDLKITVMDEDGFLIPEIELKFAEGNQTAIVDTTTAINGTLTIYSLVPMVNGVPIGYTLNASRYGTQFNTTANLHLPIAAFFNVTIVCPKMNLQINVTDGSGQPIGNANVNASERQGGLFYSGVTSADGTVALRSTLGRYLLQVYSGGIELNETTVDLNVTTVNVTIDCQLYGLNVAIKVVDYFGQPIQNVNVTLQRTGYQNSSLTGADGLVTFKNVVGGNLNWTLRLSGQSQPSVEDVAQVSSSTTIDVRLDQYILLAGMLVGTGQLVTLILIVAIVVFVLSLEIYRRRRVKPKESES
jgi:hypothetical protein